MTNLTPVDREGLTRALAMARAQSEEEREHFDEMLSREGWQEVAHAAAYACQCRTLKLKPWQAPPIHVHDNVVTSPASYGHRPEEVALRRRMLAAKVSLYEPDPVAMLERGEGAQLDVRVRVR
jgi:hypothetical protein